MATAGEQADHQAGDGDPPGAVGGQGVQQHRDRHVGGGGLQGADRRAAAARLQAEGDLRGPDRPAAANAATGYRRRGTTVAASSTLTTTAAATRGRAARPLVRAEREQQHGQQAVRLPRVIAQPAPAVSMGPAYARLAALAAVTRLPECA